MKTSEVLNKAADLIEERGWEKGEGWFSTSSTAKDSLCLEGGIMAALGLRVSDSVCDDREFAPLVYCPAYRSVVSYLERDEVGVSETGFSGQPLYWWNDDYDRTAEQVIEALRAAAVIEAARENADARQAVQA